MRLSTIAVAIAVIAVAIGVYFGLERLFPRQTDDVAVTQPAPSPMTTLPDRSPAAPQPAPQAPPAEVVVEDPMEADLAEAEPEPVPDELVAPEPVEPEPADEPELAIEPEPEPEPAPPPPRRVARAEPAYPAPVKEPPPAADLITAWWPDPAKIPAPQLKLTYAGQVEGHTAIALLFSAPLQLETLNTNAQVLDENGAPVQGRWELGKSPRLATFSIGRHGRYTVVLPPTIADTRGNLLGTQLQGPVYIK